VQTRSKQHFKKYFKSVCTQAVVSGYKQANSTKLKPPDKHKAGNTFLAERNKN